MYPAANGAYKAPNQPSGPPPAPPAQPIFQVVVTTHIGALIYWFNQRRVVTGTFAQCDKAISDAQTQNLLLGWWSLLSLIWNPISLSNNAAARKTLRQQAEQAQQYAQWWHTTNGGGQHPRPGVSAPAAGSRQG